MFNNTWKSLGPIILSALSLFIAFITLQPLALALDPSFSLLTSRGMGKIVFVSMAIFQVLLFLSIQQKNFLKQILSQTVLWITDKRWPKTFFSFFGVFFLFHAATLAIFYATGHAVYSPAWGPLSISLLSRTLFGLIVVFFLAWTEELIFRGMIYGYFSRWYNTVPSMLITSFFFMIVHNLTNPLALLTTDWKLGLGLFLLGLLLNQIYVITNKLYANMGVHAGLVFVKVILRRAPFLIFIPETEWAWWANKDLRQSPLVHLLFVIVIISVFIYNRRLFFNKK